MNLFYSSAHGKKGYLPLAAEMSEGAAELLEMAFDWDSPLAAEAWREVRIDVTRREDDSSHMFDLAWKVHGLGICRGILHR